MVKTKQQRRRNRRKGDPANPAPPSFINVISVSPAAGAAIVVFSGPVQLGVGLVPSTWVIAGNPIATAAPLSPTSITLTTIAPIIATNTYSFPGQDPALRTSSGGYVAGSTGAVV